MGGKKKRVAFSFIILVALAAFFVFEKETMANVFSGFLVYPQRAMTSVIDAARMPFRWLESKEKMIAEVEYLKNENMKMLSENVALEDALREADYVMKESQAQSMKEYALESARVIGYAPDLLGDYYIIDKGTRDGISDGMIVVANGRLLLGKVHKAYTATSAVYALAREGNKISAAIVDKEVAGIVGVKNGALEFEVSGDIQQIEDNALLITAGIDGKYPRGLLVGRVHKEPLQPQNDQISSKSFSVVPLVSFSSIQSAYIITDQRLELISHP
jgi:rod shape-determining protein MreC